MLISDLCATPWGRGVGIIEGASERASIAASLREYCKLDTYAMYAIWRKLHEIAAARPAL